MVMKKKIREKGKLRFSQYFQKFEDGDKVAVILESSLVTNVPPRFRGRTGEISGKKGKAYKVKIYDQNKEKEFLIEPIHLKKIKTKK